MNRLLLRKSLLPTPFSLIGTGIVIMLMSLSLFAKIGKHVLIKGTFRLDDIINGWMDHISSPFIDQLMVMITETGAVWWLTYSTILVALWLFIVRRDVWSMLFFIVANAIGGLLNRELKDFFERARPMINPDVDGIGFAFPSGHAMGSFILYGFLSYLIIRSHREKTVKFAFTVFFAILIILIGASRIYLNVHYPTDVIGGYAAGMVWLILCIFTLEIVRWLRRRLDERIVKVK